LPHAADVVVCDGFTGNMALKLMEGTIKTLLDEFRKEIEASARGKLGGLSSARPRAACASGSIPDTYGGAYLLGLRGLVVIAHGSSSRTAIANAITLGAQGAAGKVVERVAARLEEEVAAAPG
jgi:glycerol-3-phosphate acyltransferase PlsX